MSDLGIRESVVHAEMRSSVVHMPSPESSCCTVYRKSWALHEEARHGREGRTAASSDLEPGGGGSSTHRCSVRRREPHDATARRCARGDAERALHLLPGQGRDPRRPPRRCARRRQTPPPTQQLAESACLTDELIPPAPPHTAVADRADGFAPHVRGERAATTRGHALTAAAGGSR